jgi:hypothetical protein
MSQRWAFIVIMTVVTVVIWSGWQVFKAIESEDDVSEYSKYITPIEENFDTDIVKHISDYQSYVLVKEEDINPPSQQ